MNRPPEIRFVPVQLWGGPLDGTTVLVSSDLPPALEVASITRNLGLRKAERVLYARGPLDQSPLPRDARVFVYRRDGRSGHYVYAMMRPERAVEWDPKQHPFPERPTCKTCAGWKPSPVSGVTLTCRDCGRSV